MDRLRNPLSSICCGDRETADQVAFALNMLGGPRLYEVHEDEYETEVLPERSHAWGHDEAITETVTDYWVIEVK